MSGLCRACGHGLKRTEAKTAPCAREIFTPQTPQTPQTAGQRLETLAGFSSQPKPLNPANPATLRGLRVVRFSLRGLIFTLRRVLFAGQRACCGVCGVCGVDFSLLHTCARERRARR